MDAIFSSFTIRNQDRQRTKSLAVHFSAMLCNQCSLSFIISTLYEKDICVIYIIIYALVFSYIATGGTRKPSLPSYEGMSCNSNHHHYCNHFYTSTCYIVIDYIIAAISNYRKITPSEMLVLVFESIQQKHLDKTSILSRKKKQVSKICIYVL